MKGHVVSDKRQKQEKKIGMPKRLDLRSHQGHTDKKSMSHQRARKELSRDADFKMIRWHSFETLLRFFCLFRDKLVIFT